MPESEEQLVGLGLLPLPLACRGGCKGTAMAEIPLWASLNIILTLPSCLSSEADLSRSSREDHLSNTNPGPS